MPLLNRTKNGGFIFKAGKHAQKSLEETANQDPGYLTWIWSKLPDFALDSPVIDQLEDVMLKKGIPFK
jgi:hypothetical protein